MKVEVSSPESWKRVLDFEISEEVIDSAFDEKVTEVRRDVHLPGFRKGKVPMNIVRNRFGPAIRAEVIDTLIKKSFKDACKDKGINPVGNSHLSKLNDEAGKPLTFTIETEVEPPIEIKGYDKLKVKIAPRKIKKSEVDAAIETVRERFAEFDEVARPAGKGDYVLLDYQRVVVEGEEKKDVTSPAYPIELGASTIKDFDKGLLGRLAGETAEITIRFPVDYDDEQLAGKKAELTVMVKSVKEKRLPEINADFCKKVGNFAGEQEFRDFIEKQLQRQEAERARSEAYSKAIDQLLDKNNFDVPPSRIEQYLDHLHEEMGRRLQPGQMAPSREEVGAKYRFMAERALRRWRLISYIADKENIKPTQEEVDAVIRQFADRYGKPFDEVKQAMRKNGAIDRIRADLREQKTLSFLIKDEEPAEGE